MYPNREEAERRLADTVVVHGGRPFYIAELRGRGPNGIIAVGNYANDAGNRIQININDAAFNKFRTPKLGYFNYFEDNKNCAYVSRVPARNQRQGMSGNNLSIIKTGEYQVIENRWHTWIASDGFSEMISGQYPSLEEVVEAISPGCTIAIDNEYAVSADSLKRLTLWWRKKAIGDVNVERVLLTREFEYLREAIIEAPFLPNVVELTNE